MLDYLKRIYQAEPALVLSLVVAAVVSAAGAFGIVVDEQAAGNIVGQALVILLGGAAIRRKVSPAP